MMPMPTADNPTVNDNQDNLALPLPAVRCLSKKQAAEYLGVGLTLLAELNIPCIKFGRRRVYDKVDLDTWLDEYKQRGRAGKETLWPVKPESTGGPTRVSGGSMQYYPTANAYAEVLGLMIVRKRKRT
jgi:hypothetical protein